jgi:hypothetical protein
MLRQCRKHRETIKMVVPIQSHQVGPQGHREQGVAHASKRRRLVLVREDLYEALVEIILVTAVIT